MSQTDASLSTILPVPEAVGAMTGTLSQRNHSIWENRQWRAETRLRHSEGRPDGTVRLNFSGSRRQNSVSVGSLNVAVKSASETSAQQRLHACLSLRLATACPRLLLERLIANCDERYRRYQAFALMLPLPLEGVWIVYHQYLARAVAS